MSEERLRVLLVEDDEDDALLVREWLDESRAAKFTLEWMRTSASALQAVEAHEYDVILVDYRLGADSGVDLIRTLVSHGCLAPIILLTGVGNYIIDAQAMEAGATDYLPKAQLNTDLLERSIFHALTHKRTQRALEERSRLAAMSAAVSNALVQDGPVPDMLRHCAEAVIHHLANATSVRIWTLNPATNILELQASAGQRTRLDGPYSHVPLGQFRIGRIAQERRPYVGPLEIDSPAEPDAEKEGSQTSLFFTGYPLITKEKVVGVIAVRTRQPLTQVTVEKLAAVADTVVLGIERSRAQEALKESEQRWQTIAESLPLLVWTCDHEGGADYLNQQWQRYSGRSLTDLLGWGWLKLLHPDDVERVRTQWLASVHSGQTFALEQRFRSGTGEYRWFKAHGIPLQESLSGDVRWFGTCTDIEDQKVHAEMLRVARDELELRVRERTAELVETNEALRKEISERVRAEEALRRSERLAMLTTAATKLAHEIGNPLNGLSTTVQLMERTLQKQGENTASLLDETVQDLKQEIARLQSLLQNWRSLSRHSTQDLRPLALAQLVSDVLRPQTQYYSDQGIVFHEHFPPDLPRVLADANSLSQVVLNLCKNAIEAMPNGGTLSVEGWVEEDNVIVAISDSGIGIPEGLDVFEPFSTTKESGTGLGLAIVRQIISAHRGTITYRSAPGVGTTFMLTLAVAPSDPQEYFVKESVG
ncbi:MAG: ATP-binding protein [Candidatus Binatia bacterium]